MDSSKRQVGGLFIDIDRKIPLFLFSASPSAGVFSAIAAVRKRQRTGAVQDASRRREHLGVGDSFWTAPVLWRFSAKQIRHFGVLKTKECFVGFGRNLSGLQAGGLQ